MPQATYHFPRGFLWGTATAAHQVEGNNTNNQWWKWEQDGHTDGTSGLACDWWGGRWREDFDRAAEGGQNAHRFSVEWSRIQPTPDTWDEDALERYRAMLRGLRERGMTPMVTLHHFSDPLWLAEHGGWETDAVLPLFEKFVRKTVEALKEYCTVWCTINEPNGYALNGYVGGGLSGNWPPGKNSLRLAVHVLSNLVRAHVVGYHAIHQIQPEARVGFAQNYRSFVPHHSWSPVDRLLTKNADNLVNKTFPMPLANGTMRTPLGTIRIPEARGAQDYYGFNYYSRNRVTFDLRRPETFFSNGFFADNSDFSDKKFLVNEPDGMFEGLKWIVRTFPNLPIIISENGFPDADDKVRPRYMAQHIHQMWRAVNFNWPIKGYFHWTLVDNFEWDQGWTLRFGLWGLDLETQKRIKRPSADLYAEICKENGLSSEMVQKYCPEVFEKLFPV
ncbi:MAG: glycoside hydrolase family 1 protein [Anaerolineae bacterium]|nr:glycoside hydrolase family 1 protein [Anaerolineae bacterium]MBL8104784.1 glycoside hydrolase family 1 protein [Anaerolineales bacterium]MCC7187248.1 glycoside hydrolase family 1 protein [Anaerolineales bacterium]